MDSANDHRAAQRLAELERQTARLRTDLETAVRRLESSLESTRSDLQSTRSDFHTYGPVAFMVLISLMVIIASAARR